MLGHGDGAVKTVQSADFSRVVTRRERTQLKLVTLDSDCLAGRAVAKPIC